MLLQAADAESVTVFEIAGEHAVRDHLQHKARHTEFIAGDDTAFQVGQRGVRKLVTHGQILAELSATCAHIAVVAFHQHDAIGAGREEQIHTAANR